MQLVRLIYFSKVSSYITEKDVLEIIELAKIKNGNLGITGALVMSSKYFVQVLEGPRSEVSRLIFSICNDKRHHDLTIASVDEINSRIFEAWSMTLFSLDYGEENDRVLKHSSTKDFDPSLMRPASILNLMVDLAKLDYPGRIFQF